MMHMDAPPPPPVPLSEASAEAGAKAPKEKKAARKPRPSKHGCASGGNGGCSILELTVPRGADAGGKLEALEAAGPSNAGGGAGNRARRSSSSDSENVILKLSVGGSGATYDPYDTRVLGDSAIFESRPSDALHLHLQPQPQPCHADAAQGMMLMHGNMQMQQMQQMQQMSSPPIISGGGLLRGDQQHQQQQQQHQHQQHMQQQHQRSTAAKVVRLLAEFEEKSKTGEWPLSTSVHCYWCCHRFDTPPLGLPIKYAGGRFHVVGCFCSLECAVAYNFSAARESVDECLNRYSLINALSAQLGGARVVRPAPDRLALSIFGGHMGVEEFRAHSVDTMRHVVVNCPPMQSVTQQVEEVGDADLSSEYRYVPIDTERVTKFQEKVRLMRTKPLVNFKNTLDHTMKLKYAQPAAAGAAAPATATGPQQGGVV